MWLCPTDVALPPRPSPLRTVRPLDGGITDVHRVGALRQSLDAQRVPESRLLERRIPPQRAHPRRRTDRLRNGAIEIKHDRLHRLADRRIRIFLLQTPAVDQVTRKRSIVGLGKILKAHRAESHARVLIENLVTRCWHGDKRMMLTNTERMRIGLVQIALGIGGE